MLHTHGLILSIVSADLQYESRDGRIESIDGGPISTHRSEVRLRIIEFARKVSSSPLNARPEPSP